MARRRMEGGAEVVLSPHGPPQVSVPASWGDKGVPRTNAQLTVWGPKGKQLGCLDVLKLWLSFQYLPILPPT